jgi:hypothetical protein
MPSFPAPKPWPVASVAAIGKPELPRQQLLADMRRSTRAYPKVSSEYPSRRRKHNSGAQEHGEVSAAERLEAYQRSNPLDGKIPHLGAGSFLANQAALHQRGARGVRLGELQSAIDL